MGVKGIGKTHILQPCHKLQVRQSNKQQDLLYIILYSIDYMYSKHNTKHQVPFFYIFY